MSNYETWVVGMFLDGNYTGEDDYLNALDVVREAIDNYDERKRVIVAAGIWTKDDAERFAAEDALKEFVEASLPEPSGLVGDLIGAALSEVNWLELAEHKLQEVRETA
jgi:hypothetical protein